MSNVLIYECLRPGFHNTQRNARTHATQRSCVKTLRTQRNATHARPVLAYNITQRNVRKVPNWPNATQEMNPCSDLAYKTQRVTNHITAYFCHVTLFTSSWRQFSPGDSSCSAVVSRLFTATFETALLL